MARYKPYNYQQASMLVINFDEQLQLGTFEHALHYLVEYKLDLSVFDPHYNNDETGRIAYDPKILLKIILFAYSKGITSSREIAWCCRTNILYKALSCDSEPHFTTIAAFVSGFSDEIEALFEQILLICDQQGLLGYELFAIDGCKLPSNASKEWSGTFKELEEKRSKLKRLIRHHLKVHQSRDTAQTEAELDQQIREAQTILALNDSCEKINEFLNTHQPRIGHGQRKKEVKSNITDNESAKMKTSKGTIQGYNGIATVDEKHQIIIDAQAFGSGQEQHTLQSILEAVEDRFQRLAINDAIYQTDAYVTADTGFANEANNQYVKRQRINAYIPDNQFRSRDPKFQDQKAKYGKRHQDENKPLRKTVIPATEFHFDPDTLSCTCPNGESLSYRGVKTHDIGREAHYFAGKLSQCRHCPRKHQCMHNPSSADHRKGSGRQVSFTQTKRHHTTATEWMAQRVDTDKGKQVYSHRMSTVEPVFGNITVNKGLNRFSLRGKTKVQGQWQLFCMVHNIEKLANYGQLAA